jgi:alkylhydroperoxidase/carboxymuconolactone decarboxylase family protein YurZ
MPHIAYHPVETLDEDLQELMAHAAANGTPRPEIQAIRAHVPDLLRAFHATWDRVFRGGTLDHQVKELCRVYVSTTLECHY